MEEVDDAGKFDSCTSCSFVGCSERVRVHSLGHGSERLGAADGEVTCKGNPYRHRAAWNSRDDKVLSWGWGVFSIDTLCRRLGRTPAAIMNRAYVLGLGPPGRGYLTAQAVAEEAGCDPTTVVVVAGYLGIKLKRRPSTKYRGNGARYRRGNIYSIDQEDAERIIEKVSSHARRVAPTHAGEWDTGGKPAVCLSCGRNDRPYCARYLCRVCYKRHQKAGTLQCFPALVRRSD